MIVRGREQHTLATLSLVISVAHTKMSGRKKWKGEQSASLLCVKVFVFVHLNASVHQRPLLCI